MSEHRLDLDADEALAGSRALAAAGENLGAHRHRAGAEIAAATALAPWGRDEYGQSFERQYRPVEEQVLDAWLQLATYVRDLGESAAQSVHDNLGADADAARRVHRSAS